MDAKRIFAQKDPAVQVAERCDGVWFRRSKYYHLHLKRYVWHAWYQMIKPPVITPEGCCEVVIGDVRLCLRPASAKVRLPKLTKYL